MKNQQPRHYLASLHPGYWWCCCKHYYLLGHLGCCWDCANLQGSCFDFQVHHQKAGLILTKRLNPGYWSVFRLFLSLRLTISWRLFLPSIQIHCQSSRTELIDTSQPSFNCSNYCFRIQYEPEDSFVSKYVFHLIALTHSDSRPCAEVRTIVATFSLNYLS